MIASIPISFEKSSEIVMGRGSMEAGSSLALFIAMSLPTRAISESRGSVTHCSMARKIPMSP